MTETTNYGAVMGSEISDAIKAFAKACWTDGEQRRASLSPEVNGAIERLGSAIVNRILAVRAGAPITEETQP